MTISDEDAKLFREMTKGVRPLKSDDRAVHTPQKPLPKKIRHSADTLPDRWSDNTAQPLEASDTVEAEEVLFYVRDNLPHATLQKLKKGAFCSDLEIDLHGLTTAQAHDELQQLLRHALQQQIRCFRLIHGKGNRSTTQSPILKSWVNQWLRQQPEVLAFCSARQRDGGTGALYILLKKFNRS